MDIADLSSEYEIGLSRNHSSDVAEQPHKSDQLIGEDRIRLRKEAPRRESAGKQALRKEALFRREELPEEYRSMASRKIFDRVCELPEYLESDTILCYISFGSEVETKTFLNRVVNDGKKVYAPRVISRGRMHFYLYEPDRLVRGRWGIEEPPEDPSKIFPESIFMPSPDINEDKDNCLVIVPGTVFDLHCGRIGYNGGYYDRFLSGNPALISRTCAVAFDTQIVTEVPQQKHDVRPARVITENRLLRRSQDEPGRRDLPQGKRH